MSAHRLPALTLVGAFVVTAGAAWTAAGRRRGAPAIAGALFALQGGLHLIFSVAGSHVGDAGHRPGTRAHDMTGTHGTHGTGARADVATGTGMHSAPAPGTGTGIGIGTDAGPGAGMGVDLGTATGSGAGMGADLGTATASGAGMGADLGTATASGAGMLAVHLLAALLCGLWLARGEAAFFTLARAALAYAFTPLRLLSARVRVPDAPRRPVRGTRRAAHRPHTVVLAHALSRRGPPRLSLPRATALGAHV
ncbi:hypothetical protein [Streptomyces sp. NPDC058671]|uniref:hypothetical protein n=1 Tax=Streptomyces sp. NPDC058671 TaxID=3346590 RepID=UPI003653EDE8